MKERRGKVGEGVPVLCPGREQKKIPPMALMETRKQEDFSLLCVGKKERQKQRNTEREWHLHD